MDWSKTKTIFIITFLILDFFLGYQFMEKRSNSQLDVILETTIEEQLEANGITYVELPKEITKATYVSGKSKTFTRQEISKLFNQKVTVSNQTILQATFIHPISLSNFRDPYRLSEFLQRHILNGKDYTFWAFDEKSNTIICFQKYNGKVIYKNVSSMLLLHLNEKNEVVSYEQTLLDDLEKYEKKQEIIPAIKAIETLYKKDYLKPGDHVTSIELGYYALVQFTASQVLTPTWHIVVNGKEDYFINAFEGQIISDEGKMLE
ncbi:two-component system regulatory protein YycI [Thermaerobacillus caldiproteolyticus]|uniref:Regulatory protein YycI of two-component signal transduction system YycFG n=1 Tax=Thermaerobacillus caldiproteolyticus TaxID=247480 RepID=A0A7W0BXU3_9BACL|nr:two-component system regulatory protein YycI [Anoxybacillus caldiproteolyticus]MBA2874358.1 regulatory protein YycI of two-component signal transduction system YycFG [Anoxybacillus caldiproteolyticus]QPA30929.1 two-component system regulatory protein YycI [Anoxybacillus caldiproteolyticus]